MEKKQKDKKKDKEKDKANKGKADDEKKPKSTQQTKPANQKKAPARKPNRTGAATRYYCPVLSYSALRKYSVFLDFFQMLLCYSLNLNFCVTGVHTILELCF